MRLWRPLLKPRQSRDAKCSWECLDDPLQALLALLVMPAECLHAKYWAWCRCPACLRCPLHALNPAALPGGGKPPAMRTLCLLIISWIPPVCTLGFSQTPIISNPLHLSKVIWRLIIGQTKQLWAPLAPMRSLGPFKLSSSLLCAGSPLSGQSRWVSMQQTDPSPN